MTKALIDQLLDEMTLEEQVSLLAGQDYWSIPSIQRLNLGELRVTDGPNGARGGGSLIGGLKSACFPCGIALGATWNTDLLKEIGSAIADEVKSKDAHLALAPTVNLQRTPVNGRNFECYSEDAVLTAALAVNYIKGLQEKNIGATIKHLVGNESEYQRTTMNSVIDERTLREHYLYPFEQAVKAGDTWAIMSSYNKLNGVYTSENEWLLTKVLRDEWGFAGIIMSDWFGSDGTANTINAGLNLEMPGPTRDRGGKLVEAVKNGEVAAEQVRFLAGAMLRVFDKAGVLQHYTKRVETADDKPEHRALIRQAGAEATVLLKNNGILPLSKNQKIAVLGPNAETAQIMGGGSAQLNPHYAITPLAGLIAQLGQDNISYAKGCTNHRYEPLLKGDFSAKYYANTRFEGEAVYEEQLTQLHAFLLEGIADGKVTPHEFSILMEGDVVAEETALYHLGTCAAGFVRIYLDDKLIVDAWGDKWQRGSTFFEEGCNEVLGTASLVEGQSYQLKVEFACVPMTNLDVSGYRIGMSRHTSDADIAEAVALAKEAETAILFVGRNGEWDTEGGDVPHIDMPSRQNELISAVAAVNPNTVVVLQTGGPVEMPWINEVAAVMESWYPGQEAGNAIADVLLGEQEPSGRLPQTFPVKYADNPTAVNDPKVYPGIDGSVVYQEGEMFGYRHYDKHQIAPLFPFGFGLGYTQFELSDVSVKASESGYQLQASVTNTGERVGNAVLQAYVIAPEGKVERAPQALKAFAKTKVNSGQSKEVTLTFSMRDFSYYDVEKHAWNVPAGQYQIALGWSSREIIETVTIDIAEELILAV